MEKFVSNSFQSDREKRGKNGFTKSQIIKVEKLGKSFTNKKQDMQVLTDISFTINQGEIISILGESGCGKSTLLNIIGGFEKATSGQVLLDG